PGRPGLGENAFVSRHQWQGTRDIAAFLATTAAIEFQAAHDWPVVRARCRELLAETRQRVEQLTGMPSLCPDRPAWFTQLAAVAAEDPHRGWGEEFLIEVPVMQWNGRKLLRIAIQAYNPRAAADRLLDALGRCL